MRAFSDAVRTNLTPLEIPPTDMKLIASHLDARSWEGVTNAMFELRAVQPRLAELQLSGPYVQLRRPDMPVLDRVGWRTRTFTSF
jgi:hypothetical protein